mmetsp:Transcript_57203/g.139465  ORF Transcript_57203/g.139465 Transcript_57203/m.139465 type:complete len:137 (-) Transcript_57203:2720-3130(-)
MTCKVCSNNLQRGRLLLFRPKGQGLLTKNGDPALRFHPIHSPTNHHHNHHHGDCLYQNNNNNNSSKRDDDDDESEVHCRIQRSFVFCFFFNLQLVELELNRISPSSAPGYFGNARGGEEEFRLTVSDNSVFFSTST